MSTAYSFSYSQSVGYIITCLSQTKLDKLPVLSPEVQVPRKRQEIMHKLQVIVAPDIFTPRGLYDGKAILYASHELRLMAGGAGQVSSFMLTPFAATALTSM